MLGPILIVDDDWGMREVLEETLKLAGYQALSANDGIEALEKVLDKLPSLILLDIMMPRMSGLDFVRELQARNLRSVIPILVLSASGHAEQYANQIGAEGFIGKPFELDELLDEIKRVLR